MVTPVHHHLVIAASRNPDKLALVAEPDVTYRLLDHRTTAISALLQSRGVSKQDRVAICLPKCNDYVVAIFSTLKAGAIYVPIDARQPSARQTTIIRDAEPTVLITNETLLTSLKEQGLSPEIEVIKVTDSDFVSPEFPLEAGTIDDGAQADDLAVLLFTSGSTGVPKGVQITHGNLHNFVEWAVNELDLDSSDVFSQHAGFHFDLSTFDLYAAVACGGSIWVVSEDEQGSPVRLAQGMERYGVTVWYSVPSILTLLLNSKVLSETILERLRYVLFAGEVFPIKHMKTLKEHLNPNCGFYNLYGPTETNVCTYYRVDEIDSDRTTPMPIGFPLPNVKAWIHEPDSEGIGELIIQGPCVTPGYWRRAGNPAEQHHLQNSHPTGDLVSLENHAYLYRGRKDRMIKLNGYRIELGEIETALLGLDDIDEVAIIPVTDESGTKLVACYSGEQVGLLRVKQHVSKHLPRYMIPHNLKYFEKLPKNANGKIDIVTLLRSLNQAD
jgi:L-proline---[L-prolyl-carrier protein] ligase